MIDNKKIAIIYRGMYLRNKPHNKQANFFNLIENHKKMLLQYFDEYDLFYSTSPISKFYDDKFIKLLNWESCSKFRTDNRSCHDSIQNSLKLCDLSKYDIIINLRFDLQFNKPIQEFNIDFDKINFLWKEPSIYNRKNAIRVSDLILIFPYSFFHKITNIDLTKYHNGKMMMLEGKKLVDADVAHHYINLAELNESQINYMVNGEHYSGGHKSDPEGKSYIEIKRGI